MFVHFPRVEMKEENGNSGFSAKTTGSAEPEQKDAGWCRAKVFLTFEPSCHV